jgi:hypothetical protein
MGTGPSVRYPKGLGASGRRLWKSVLTDYELEQHEEALLVQACRTADTLEDLQCVIDAEGVLLDTKPHPALVEARQQRLVLARLIVALRVPLGEEASPHVGSPRLQYRGIRGVYPGGAA